MIDELLIRLEEQRKIYKDSPNVTVTYTDLARMVENLIEIIKRFPKNNIGILGKEE